MDCPICTSAKGLKDRQELVQHMEIHRDDPELMIEKIADYISARLPIFIFLISLLDDLRKDTSIKTRPRSINDSL